MMFILRVQLRGWTNQGWGYVRPNTWDKTGLVPLPLFAERFETEAQARWTARTIGLDLYEVVDLAAVLLEREAERGGA